MRVLLALLVLAPSAVAQSPSSPDDFRDKKILRNADVNQLWQTLGISGKIRKTTAAGAKQTDETFNCAEDNRCEAQRIGLTWPLLDGAGDAVVRVAPAYLNANMRRFLLFHQEGDNPWRFVDYLDSTEWDYDEPFVSTVSSGGKRWLVVQAWPHCGTGCSLVHTDWFELKNGKLRMVLTVPLSGHDNNENPGRQFETRFVRGSQSASGDILEFVYHVEYGSGIGSSIEMSDLWDDEKIVRFYRPIGQGEFKFDAKNPEGSQAFVKEIFRSSDVGLPRLFDLIQDHLLAIARGPHDRRWQWLKEMLEQNPYLDQLARVRAAFTKAR
ncbi:MAG: hypothetical protein M3N41_00520 [Acidobacteriota bacterium]|nr:hypothetical protein [Acidobacteriota bacterium]